MFDELVFRLLWNIPLLSPSGRLVDRYVPALNARSVAAGQGACDHFRSVRLAGESVDEPTNNAALGFADANEPNRPPWTLADASAPRSLMLEYEGSQAQAQVRAL